MGAFHSVFQPQPRHRIGRAQRWAFLAGLSRPPPNQHANHAPIPKSKPTRPTTAAVIAAPPRKPPGNLPRDPDRAPPIRPVPPNTTTQAQGWSRRLSKNSLMSAPFSIRPGQVFRDPLFPWDKGQHDRHRASGRKANETIYPYFPFSHSQDPGKPDSIPTQAPGLRQDRNFDYVNNLTKSKLWLKVILL